MADRFDSLVTSGAATQAMAIMASMAAQNRNTQMQMADRRDARESASFERLSALRSANMQTSLQNRTLDLEAQRADREFGMRQEESAFQRLNQSLEMQLKLADREAGQRDQAFQRSMQMASHGVQMKVAEGQLREMEGRELALGLVPKVNQLVMRTHDLLTSSAPDTKQLNAAIGEFDALMDAEGVEYLAQISPDTFNRITQARVMLSERNMTLRKLDPDAFGDNYKAGELPELAKGFVDGRVSVEKLNFLGHFKASTNLGAGSVDADQVRVAIQQYFGAGSTRAQEVEEAWLGTSEREQHTLSVLKAAPKQDLQGDALHRYAEQLPKWDQMLREAASMTGVDGALAEFHIEQIKHAQLRSFYAATGARAPEMEAMQAGTMHGQMLQEDILTQWVRAIPGASRDFDFYINDSPMWKDTTRKYTPGDAVNLHEAIQNGWLWAYPKGESPPKGLVSRAPGESHRVGLSSEAARDIQLLDQDVADFVQLFSTGNLGTLSRSPDSIIQSMQTRAERISGATGIRVDVAQFLPPVLVARSDYIARSLAKEGRSPFSDEYNALFLSRIRDYDVGTEHRRLMSMHRAQQPQPMQMPQQQTAPGVPAAQPQDIWGATTPQEP